MNPAASAPESTDRESSPLRFLIVYDDAAAARRALHASEVLLGGLDRYALPECALWRADLLDAVICRDEIRQAARDADFILLSSSQPSVPQALARFRRECRADPALSRVASLTLVGTGDKWGMALECGEEVTIVNYEKQHACAPSELVACG